MFVNDPQTERIFLFLKDDFTVVKIFFSEFLEVLKTTLPKLLDESLDIDKRRKLQQIVPICDNNLCERGYFNFLFEETLKDFVQEIVKIALVDTSLQNDREFLIFTCHVRNALQLKQVFILQGENKTDFNKYYENIEKLDAQSLLKFIKT